MYVFSGFNLFLMGLGAFLLLGFWQTHDFILGGVGTFLVVAAFLLFGMP